MGRACSLGLAVALGAGRVVRSPSYLHLMFCFLPLPSHTCAMFISHWAVVACRRIANRESARRVRAKRAELMDELQARQPMLCCTGLDKYASSQWASQSV